ncbi:hypothetical protein [Pseudaminobacter sp. NGMCC 1.201702]|uniref:hypothetical protein n=1 Tax=Pseudaminobacter sp. NGMCC 1.201702 TaxID=3391825 RepID=UPI0039F10444
MGVTQGETIAAENSDLDRKIDFLAFEPAGTDLTDFDFKMLALTGIVAPALLLLWGWA